MKSEIRCRPAFSDKKNKAEVFGNKARVLKNNAGVLSKKRAYRSSLTRLSLVAFELIASAL